MTNNKIVIDLEGFRGKSPRELKTHVEQIISNIKCVVQVPTPDGMGRRAEFQLSSQIDLRVDFEEYPLVEIINEN